MKVMRTIGKEIVYQDIQPEHFKQFHRRGWIEAPKNVELPEVEPPKDRLGLPDYDNLKRDELIGFAVENGMAKGKAAQMKKEDLITFLKS